MKSILVIEDQQDVNRMIAEALTDAGYQVTSAYTGPDGINALRNGRYDLVLLDLMLPYKSGDEVLREMRPFSDIPVIVVSAKDMVGTKIDLLKLGADDYITKPFDLGEMTARVECALRRAGRQKETPRLLRYKDMVLDDTAKRVTIGQTQLELTAKEYQLLKTLLLHQNKVFTKANLYETIWQEEYLGDDSAVKTHISNLRGKLKTANPNNAYIETVWRLGYRLYTDGSTCTS